MASFSLLVFLRGTTIVVVVVVVAVVRTHFPPHRRFFFTKISPRFVGIRVHFMGVSGRHGYAKRRLSILRPQFKSCW